MKKIQKAEFAAQLEKAKADLDKVKQLFSVADKSKVAKVAKVVKAVQKKNIDIPFVDPSVYDKEAEELYNRTELQKEQVKELNKSMAKLKKIKAPVKAKTPVKAKIPVKAKTPVKAPANNEITQTINKLKEQQKELTKEVKKLENNSNYRLSDAKEIQHDIKKFVKEYQGLEKKIKKLPNNKKLLADIAYLDDKVDDMDLILEEFFDEHEGNDDDDDY